MGQRPEHRCDCESHDTGADPADDFQPETDDELARLAGEQIGQILSARRFDGETRSQVVRLIDERARQLVPTAAKRVLNDWTQSTLAAHRGQASRADAGSSRREVAPASSPAGPSANTSPGKSRLEAGATPQRVDYRKFSDEQILEM